MASVFLFPIKVYSSASDVAWRFCGTPNSGRGYLFWMLMGPVSSCWVASFSLENRVCF